MNIAHNIENWRKAGIALFVKDGQLGARSKPGAMTSEISGQIKTHKVEIIQFLEEIDSEKAQSFEVGDPTLAVASYAQQRFWILHQITGGSPHHNMAFTLPLANNTQLTLVKECIDILVSRHTSLRTFFYKENGQIFQQVDENTVPKLSISYVENDLELVSSVNSHHLKTFDLCRAPLVDLAVFKSTEGKTLLSVVMHHAIGDDWSTSILGREFLSIYEALKENRHPSLPEIKHSYADHARWQNKLLLKDGKPSKTLEGHLEFWRNELSDAPRSIAFPIEEISGDQQSYHGERVTLAMPDEVSSKLRDYAKHKGVSMFELMITSLSALMFKWSNTDDVVIGTVEAGREQQEVINMIGCFINFLAVRSQYSSNDTLASLLGSVQRKFGQIRKHQTCPFDLIVNEINPARGNKSPLYNVSLRYQNIQLLESSSQEALLDELVPDSVNAQLDLMFSFVDIGENTALCLDYNTTMFKPQLADALLSDYLNVILTFVESEELLVRELELSENLLSHSESSTYIMSNFAAEPMQPTLSFWQNKLDLMQNWKFAPFNQVQQELLNPNSPVYSDLTSGCAIMINWETWLVGDDVLSFAKTQSQQLLNIVFQQASILKSCHLVFCPISPSVEAIYHQRLKELEAAFVTVLAEFPTISVITSEHISKLYLTVNPFDEDSFNTAKMPYTEQGYAALSTVLVRSMYHPRRQQTKVLVLDCDNTLWHGVVGEIGAKNLEISAPFKAIQKLALSLKKRGVLLALCSKNEESDVWSAFTDTPEMLLTSHDITTTRINWESKSANIRSIASELNLGLDSFVFIDDDPIQCGEVLANCPEVLVLQRPEISKISDWLEHLWVFDDVLSDDSGADRTTLYKENSKRNQLKKTASTFSDYLESLKTQVTFSAIDGDTISRVAELSLRTNQFNTNLQRYDELTLTERIKTQHFNGFTVHVSDIFGDLGIVGAALWEENEGRCKLDSFLLSCRAMGRGIEHQMISKFGELTRGHICDIPVTVGERNTPARSFLSDIGAYPAPTNLTGDDLAKVQFNAPETNVNSQVLSVSETTNHPIAKTAIPLSAWAASALYYDIEDIITESSQYTQNHAKTREYVEPHTTIQRLLCDEIASLLRIEKVGLRDNFFSLGGNSIQAVQLQSALTKKGISFALPLLFGEHDIETLAAGIEHSSDHHSTLSVVDGTAYEIGLNDHWLLKRPQRNHWNVSELIVVKEDFNTTNAKTAVTAVLKHHDGLRRVWRQSEGIWSQFYQPLDEMSNWWIDYDLSQSDATNQLTEIENICDSLQRGLDIENQLFYVARFNLGDNRLGRILLVFHHLIVDGYSLGVLKEDLALAYAQVQAGQSVDLPSTQIQLNQLVHHQIEQAKESVQTHMDYWLNKDWSLCEDIYRLPLRNCNHAAGSTTSVSHSQCELVEPLLVSTPLDDELTGLLENELLSTQFDIETVVVSALSLAYEKWTNGNKPFLCITRNNRSHEVLNLSRTVGWVSRYDFIYIDQPYTEDIEDYLVSISQQISESEQPSQALQYARFKDTPFKNVVSQIPEHNLEFNYVPNVSVIDVIADNLAPENKGKEEGMHPSRFAPFGKLCTDNGKLTLVWGYSPAMYSNEDISRFSSLHVQQIKRIVTALVTNDR